jgi:hypothetical protein
MRVNIFNPVYGDPEVEQPKDKWALSLAGPWSEPSPPAALPPLVEFFFVGTFGERANLELHRWILGQWVIVPSVPVPLGAPILFQKKADLVVPGSGEKVTETVDLNPGAVLVDLMRNYLYQPPGGNQPIRTSVLVTMEAQGDVGRRIEWEDKKDAANRKIERQSMAPTPPKPPPGP